MRLSPSARLAMAFTATLFLLLASQETSLAAIDCFKCHDRSAFQKKVKHPPAAGGECITCHSPHVAKYKGLLQEKVQNLCYSCHQETATAHRQGLAHLPVRKGECLACHNPHASEHGGLLNKSLAETCFTCHSGLPKKFKFTHTPYANGQCAACHRAHQSNHAALLVKEPDALCLNCHSPQTVQQRHPNFPTEPDNCGSCHNPHGSDRPDLIRNILHEPYAAGCKDCHTGKGAPVTVDTCLACHPQVGEQMASSHNHMLRYGNNGCTACHSPHAGDSANLLKGKERHVCGSCHESTFRRIDEAHYKHTMDGSCSDCHALHGSNHPVMVKDQLNMVCATCHAQHGQFTHPIGEKIFDPRTGQMMTCASCHASKGTDYESHLRFSGARDLCVQCHRDR